MTNVVDIQRNSDAPSPTDDEFRRWVNACTTEPPIEVSILLTDKNEITELNQRFRNKHKPTNVLSFPADLPEHIETKLLGDIIICSDVVNEEAKAQDKTEKAHWAHMTIHGMLHLLGYDHISDDEAEVMENLETSILTGMGFPAPYE